MYVMCVMCVMYVLCVCMYVFMYVCMYVRTYVCMYVCECRDNIVVRVLGWDMKVAGSIPADVNYTGYASETSMSLGECLRLRSNHNLDLNGRLAESQKRRKMYVCMYV